jgi:hypothetical protein
MEGLPALIDRLALDRAIEGRPDLLREGDGAAPLEAPSLAARLGVDVDLARAASTDAASATLPAGVRLGRLAFNPALQAALAAGEATVPPRVFRLPETKKALMVFFAKCTGFGGGEEGTVAPRSMMLSIVSTVFGSAMSPTTALPCGIAMRQLMRCC